jgi:iron complex transport system ATP-binding protein
MLEAIDVSLDIGHKKLLSQISLSIKPKEFVAICGPNGAGKSTLMRLFSGEINPSQGQIRWHGRSMHQWPAKDLAKCRALLQQQAEVGFDYTTLEVILLGRHPHHQGAVRAGDVEIAQSALQELNSMHLATRAYATLSGGEKAIVQLARAIAQIWESGIHPRLLLLDEPTAALDALQQHRILRVAKQWASKVDVAVVAIVHDLNLAAQYADRIALIKDGRLQIIGETNIVMTTQTIEACFDLPCVQIAHPHGGPPLIASSRHFFN